eukprot:COSAG02_NODE_4648_length_5134_cov_35.775372_1_plen_279_part_00
MYGRISGFSNQCPLTQSYTLWRRGCRQDPLQNPRAHAPGHVAVAAVATTSGPPVAKETALYKHCPRPLTGITLKPSSAIRSDQAATAAATTTTAAATAPLQPPPPPPPPPPPRPPRHHHHHTASQHGRTPSGVRQRPQPTEGRSARTTADGGAVRANHSRRRGGPREPQALGGAVHANHSLSARPNALRRSATAPQPRRAPSWARIPAWRSRHRLLITQNSPRSLQNCTFLCLEYTEVYVQTFPGARGWDRRFRCSHFGCIRSRILHASVGKSENYTF